MTSPTETRSAIKHEHFLPQQLLSRRVDVLLVGCGGTGSTMATGLVFLHQAMLAFGHPSGLHLTIVDGDRISRTNCVRQPFSESEIGLYKADVLASRINMLWGLGWRSDIRFLDRRWSSSQTADIIISCVDTRQARKTITESDVFNQALYWLDLGNGAETGQYVLGQTRLAETLPKGSVRLPNAAELFPEIIDPRLDGKDKLPSCSALEALESQSPFVNQILAYQALAMLARFFRFGKLTHHGGFANLASGRVSSLPIDPAVWHRIVNSGSPGRRATRKSVPSTELLRF